MKIHEFDNGIKVYNCQLMEVQRLRYAKRNVHEEDEEDIFIEAIQSLPRDSRFVSVGTAIGYYPLLAKKLRPDINVFCFEPLPSHLVFFHDNIELNGFKASDFKIHDMAVSTEATKVIFKDLSYGSHVTDETTDPTAIMVDAIPLDQVFNQSGIDDVDLLQMDIQGHEAPVLRAYFSSSRTPTSPVIRAFLIGTHGDSIHQECRDLLLANDYVLKVDEPHTVNQPDGIIYGIRRSTTTAPTRIDSIDNSSPRQAR